MTMITPSYLGETIEYSSLHACRSTLEDPNHAFFGLEQGAERHPTLYWRDRSRTGPTFHIDYVFVPKVATNLLLRVAVGSYAKWIAKGLSDHAPVIVDFLPEFAARLTSGNPSRS